MQVQEFIPTSMIVTSSGKVLASLKIITLELSRQHTPMSIPISDPGYWYHTER
jgi:hypothetical protein